MFNLAQLATYDEARELAAKMSVGPIIVGGGVRPGTDETPSMKPGIYRPVWSEQPWSQEPHYEDPKTGKKYYFLHFRFNNGAEGMNVGLCLDKFTRFPMSPMYVMWQLAEEAERMKP